MAKLREMQVAETYRERISTEDFSAIPFINANGYHSKTVAYSLWHIFRIEDIVTHSLINQDEEVLFRGQYQKRIGAPIITTGNELVKQQIADFSKELNIDELYQYVREVKKSTDQMLRGLTYADLNRKMGDEDKARLVSLQVVSTDEKAFWLIDFWCGKTVKGLLQMPLSRHWIMHIEASGRIISKLRAEAKDK